MKELFEKEEQVAGMAEVLLAASRFSSVEDETNYRFLYKEYKTLLRQMMRVVKLSDLMQLELKTMSEKLESVSQIDSLTELYNKRYFNEACIREWRNAARLNCSIALIMIDIDYFKKYNDTYGHLQGDECLKTVAAEIRHSVSRPRDIVARFGGEEFVVLLPETGIEGASLIAQKVLENVEKLAIEHVGSALGGKVITVSLGVAAAFPEEVDTMEVLLKQVDQALYAAKNTGRNCFEEYKMSRNTGIEEK